MTVLDTELCTTHHPHQPTAGQAHREELERLMSANGTQAALFCSNINQLDMPYFQKADQFVHQMAMALLSEQVEAFNEAKQQLISLLKKQAEPVTQWNPLVLELSDAYVLRGRHLSQINLSMTSLRSVTGFVSLEGAHLQSANFLCADLSHLSLVEADLSGADCRYGDFRDVNMTQAVLIEADLSHAKLSGATLSGTDLYCAKLNGALIKQANLNEANLRKADLRNADLYQADFTGARLQNADLRESNLFMANLTRARLRHADLRKAHLSFCNFQEARMPNARLENANLTSADLSQADLQKCRLSQSITSRTRFTQAKMSFAHLQDMDLSEAIELETAMLQGAMFDQDTRFPKGFKPRKAAMICTRFNGVQGFTRWAFGLLKTKAVSASGVTAQ